MLFASMGRVVVPVAGAVVMLACSGGSGPTATAEDVARVDVTPAQAIFHALGQTLRLEASSYTDAGRLLEGRDHAWSTSDPAVASVDGSGLVRAEGNGSATITASDGSARDEARVTVAQEVRSAGITPTDPTLESLGATLELVAVARDSLAHPVDRATFEWTSSDEDVAPVDDGTVTAVANGVATISAATDEGMTAETAVTVDQAPATVLVDPDPNVLVPGSTLPLGAEALDALGSPVVDASFEWSASEATVARVDESGFVTAEGLGDALIRARSEEAVGEAGLRVVSPEWPNEPPGLETLTDVGWRTLQDGGWVHANRFAQSRIVSDSTAPLSQPDVLEHLFPRGLTSRGVEPAINWYHAGGRVEIYVGAWWKPSDPWHGHSSGINKVFFFWSGDHTADVVATMRGSPGGPYHMQVVAQGQPDPRTNYLEQNVQQVPVTLDKWHRLEFHLVARTDGTGVIRWWQDGQLLGEYTDFDFHPGGWGQIEVAPTWGGVGGPDKRQDDFFRYDHVYISGR